MLYTTKEFIIKHNFIFPFFIGALMCSMWGGFVNLAIFIGLLYAGSFMLKAFKQPVVVQETEFGGV